ncbi:hypothetical protein [Albimonas pacifica]|uniref:Uncharacterized protein n=1 Tax=Albimonas pacifica TaxID=1114924 RepID=A0A1I3K8H6_9RHOB|nr:hypothetical protein [Albimonas pacifica]SFI68630.1 hypothetical protein SAMN05216258_108337 [Albimonas pacifica]
MARKIDGISYPDKVMDILKDRTLAAVLREDCSGVQTMVNALDFLASPPKGRAIWDDHLGPKAKKPVLITGMMKKLAAQAELAERLAAKKPADLTPDERRTLDRIAMTDRDWRGMVEIETANLRNFFDRRIMDAFFTRPTFRAHHQARRLAEAKKTMGDPKKAASLLGVKDPRKLEALMLAQALGDEAGAKKAAAALVSAEKLPMTPEAAMASVRTRKPPVKKKATIDASTKKLQLCGFRNCGDPRLRELAKRTATAFATDQMSAAKGLYRQLRQLEGKSLAGNTDFDAMMRVFVDRKVISR